MPPPKPPSSIQTITFPVFGISWFADPGDDGESIVAYGGGGGSAKTGFNNRIIVSFLKEDEDITISTGDDVCVNLVVYQEFPSKDRFVLAAIGQTVRRYSLPTGQPAGQVNVGEGCNTLAVHGMGQVFVVGCDEGPLHVYQMPPKNSSNSSSTDDAAEWTKLFSCLGHEKTVCGVSFAARSDRIVSSAKDGTARVWKQGGDCISVMKHDITDPDDAKKKAAAPAKKTPKRATQILVRGCAFGDLEGNVVVSVASGRKGKAFLNKWTFTEEKNEYELSIRDPVHDYPISSMNLGVDGCLLALGAVDGSILLLDVVQWRLLHKFREVHELPVTCIAARPLFHVPLAGDEHDIPLHARSASADSKMGLLTLSKKRVKRAKPAQELKSSSSSSSTILSLPKLIVWCLLLSFLHAVYEDTMDLCAPNDLGWECIRDEVLWAPSSRPGIVTKPY
mmetsp:Transcript_29116/g.44009  ORF Transcript_29116/g.44009 Transcript_29116/m.44009 type:complete len:448 (+) Transcript_29116:136-1479(+)